MKKIITAILLITSFNLFAQQRFSERMATTVMQIWKDSMALDGKPAKWTYDQGVVLKGIEGLWKRTADKTYFDYIQKSMDFFVGKDGKIRTYKKEDYNIDNVLPGRNLLTLYNVTGKEQYYKAARTLRDQMLTHPRTNEGGFWHKKRYPYQMWLDGLYMAQPFLSEWAATFHEDSLFDDIANQFIWMENHSRDAKTGLMYHGWDESKQEKWADPKTGLSPNFWARAMGWYGMALVDALEYFPENHPKQKQLVQILNRFTTAVQKVQDPKSGLWWDILDMPGKKLNYLESSASSMFVYAIAKGVRLGYLPSNAIGIAEKGWSGLTAKFIVTDANGQTNLEGTVSVSGLGGNNPYRDGSYEYYMSEKVVTNDPKGVGAFLLAANEMEILPDLVKAKGKRVLLDSYFNNEFRKDITGVNVSYHYKWHELAHLGFGFLGEVFKQYGFSLSTLNQKPDLKNLKQADVFIIVDADNEKETTKPNFVQAGDVSAIAEWVKNGGILVLMANDSTNAELDKFSTLAEKFGIAFKKNSLNHVEGNAFEQGAVMTDKNNLVFKSGRKLYLKEISTLTVNKPAVSILENNGEIIMATSKYGKGTVFAVGDPWLYNEYVDGRKLPASFENFGAAHDLVQWIIKQLPKK